MARPRRTAALVLCALGLLVLGLLLTGRPAAADPDDVPDRWNGRPGLLADLDGRTSVPVPMPRVDPVEPGALPIPRARAGTRAVPIPEAQVGSPRLDPPRPGPPPGQGMAPPLGPRDGVRRGPVTDPLADGPVLGPPLRDPRLP